MQEFLYINPVWSRADQLHSPTETYKLVLICCLVYNTFKYVCAEYLISCKNVAVFLYFIPQHYLSFMTTKPTYIWTNISKCLKYYKKNQNSQLTHQLLQGLMLHSCTTISCATVTVCVPRSVFNLVLQLCAWNPSICKFYTTLLVTHPSTLSAINSNKHGRVVLK